VDEYIESLLSPDAAQLRDIASRMRFIEEDPMIQWSILELRDFRPAVAQVHDLAPFTSSCAGPALLILFVRPDVRKCSGERSVAV
jgi:hypothetical protein